jgi:hypothetical protein
MNSKVKVGHGQPTSASASEPSNNVRGEQRRAITQLEDSIPAIPAVNTTEGFVIG